MASRGGGRASRSCFQGQTPKPLPPLCDPAASVAPLVLPADATDTKRGLSMAQRGRSINLNHEDLVRRGAGDELTEHRHGIGDRFSQFIII